MAGKTTDTRSLVRQAAENLLKQGVRSDKITVDLIKAEIGQGSRTTVNDELKIWKNEQAKNMVLSGSMPSDVSGAMINLWQFCLEQANQSYQHLRDAADESMDEMADKLHIALTNIQGLQANLEHQEKLNGTLNESNLQQKTELNTLLNFKEKLTASLEAEKARSEMLVNQIEDTRKTAHTQFQTAMQDASRVLADTKSGMQTQIDNLQNLLHEKENQHSIEITSITTRLEGVQRHVLMQVEEARTETRQLEEKLNKAQQKNSELADKLHQTSTKLAFEIQKAVRASQDVDVLSDEIKKLRKEYEILIQQNAKQTGQIEVYLTQIASLEQRASKAETRLEDELKKRRQKNDPQGS